MIDRFGPEIEYDLHAFLGVDLLEFFRGHRPWPQLLRLLERLPREGQYKAALADDDELAREYLDRGGDATGGEEQEPTFEGFDRHVECLYIVIDLLQALCIMTAGKKDKPKPMPRPTAALERVRRDVAYEQHLDLVKQLLPNKDTDSVEGD